MCTVTVELMCLLPSAAADLVRPVVTSVHLDLLVAASCSVALLLTELLLEQDAVSLLETEADLHSQ